MDQKEIRRMKCSKKWQIARRKSEMVESKSLVGVEEKYLGPGQKRRQWKEMAPWHSSNCGHI